LKFVASSSKLDNVSETIGCAPIHARHIDNPIDYSHEGLPVVTDLFHVIHLVLIRCVTFLVNRFLGHVVVTLMVKGASAIPNGNLYFIGTTLFRSYVP